MTISGRAPTCTRSISVRVVASYNSTLPGLVLGEASTATASRPSRQATLLMVAPGISVARESTSVGVAGLLASSTSTAPDRALTMKMRWFTGSKAGISAALTS